MNAKWRGIILLVVGAIVPDISSRPSNELNMAGHVLLIIGGVLYLHGLKKEMVEELSQRLAILEELVIHKDK